MSSILIHSRHFSFWYNELMSLYACAARRLCCAILCSVCLAMPGARASAADTVSQTRINEWAAKLLKAHLAIIETPGLRRNGERLDLYLQRIAAPLPDESAAQWRLRQQEYAAALIRVADPRGLCTAAPRLRDTGARNVANWRKATNASALLPERCAKAVAAIKNAETEYSAGTAREAGVEMTRALFILKDAFEALREARP